MGTSGDCTIAMKKNPHILVLRSKGKTADGDMKKREIHFLVCKRFDHPATVVNYELCMLAPQRFDHLPPKS